MGRKSQLTSQERLERKREYDRERLQIRRLTWLDENGPCKKCGSRDRLEVDHIYRDTKNPKLRASGNALWSWSDERRKEELAKCQVLCHKCHLKKTRQEVKENEEIKYGIIEAAMGGNF